jgi:excinuclease ABC subunit C
MSKTIPKELSQLLAKLPSKPGIYLFYNTQKELIYVGKATALKSRVRSYFLGKRTPRPIEEMIHEVVDIKYKQTDSVLEAVILESVYIKKYLPKYNVIGKDDKSWNYIVVSKELYPHVSTLREHDVKLLKLKNPRALKQFKYFFGPYPGLNTKAAMKLLRRIFHFSTCKPLQGKPCLYRQMGQCLGVCTGEISAFDYVKKVIRPLALFLQGHKKKVIKEFEKRMKAASKVEDFEEAALLRDQLKALYRIHDVALLNDSFFKDLITDVQGITRIEGYDISNLGSTDKVGSMVVFNMSGPLKSEYRKFNIKSVVGQSDVDSLAEVMERRLKHSEWPLPQLFLIDGGRGQVNKIKAVLEARKVTIPVVGIAKGPERKRNDFILGSKNQNFIEWVSKHQDILIKVRDEAHRFAITFNRSKRKII